MKYLLLLLFITISLQACASTKDSSELQTVDYVDLNKYMGRWYSITSLPQRFTNKCLSQSADYKIINTNEVSVLNTCYKKNKTSSIKGTAKVDDEVTNADLTVFFRLLWGLLKVQGDYKILALDEDYQYVMVGSSDRKSLWIMSRKKFMPKSWIQKYTERAKFLGFDTSELQTSIFP